MRKLPFFFILIVFPLVLGSWYSVTKYVPKNPQAKSYTVDKTAYDLLEAKNPSEWEKGLMYVRKKDGFDGMVFLFPDKTPRTFWNKNTYVDLDVIWMNDEVVVGKSFLPSIEKSHDIVTVSSSSPVNRVVEIIR